MTLKPLTRHQVEALLRFLPIFEQEDFRTGEWVTLPGLVPYFSYSTSVEEFINALHQNDCVLDYLDHLPQQPDSPEAIETADLNALREMFTAAVRTDRYVEGYFADLLKKGRIAAMVRRLDTLIPPEPPREGGWLPRSRIKNDNSPTL